jgi:hypothetical protein
MEKERPKMLGKKEGRRRCKTIFLGNRRPTIWRKKGRRCWGKGRPKAEGAIEKVCFDKRKANNMEKDRSEVLKKGQKAL